MKHIKSFIAIIIFSMFSLALNAQERMIKGKVLDTGQQPLIGASVLIEGTTKGTVTDINGAFSLKVPDTEVKLTIASLSYISKTVTVPAGKNSIIVILQDDAVALTETVVVGYGTQKKVNLTGAITTLDSKKLQDRSAGNLSTLLQGTVPGLNITTSSGVPGSTGSLNIRGCTSINGAAPMVIIDGAVGDMNRINPNDVENISVIKDAAAAAVYGARAAFGVILITTKSGKAAEGKSTVRYSGRFGWSEPTTSTNYETRGYWSVYTMNKFRIATKGSPYILYNDYDMQQLLLRVNDKKENPERPWVMLQNRNGKDQWVYYGNNDWYHNLYRDRHPQQQHNISLSGGSKKAKYFVSGGFNEDVGIIRENPDKFRKYNIRSKVDFDINKYVRFSNNTSIYTSKYHYIGVDNAENAIAYSASHALPIFPMKNPDGSWLYESHFLNGSYYVCNGRHIVFNEGNDKNNVRWTDATNTSELKIKPFKTFTLIGNFTYRFNQRRADHRKTNFRYREYPGQELQIYDSGAGLNRLAELQRTYNYYSANIFGTYEESFGHHNVKAMIGGNYETQKNKNLSAYGNNLLTDNLSDLDLIVPGPDGTIIQEVGGGKSEYALLGFFGRLNYNYKGKYLFEFSGRYDGSSRFARGNRWGFFPSVSAGWRISEEAFFDNLRETINNLKIRASFGSLGNQNVSDYQFMRTVSIYDFKGFNFGESGTTAKYASLSAPNASDLTWERTEQYNLGLDVSAFNSRLQMTAEAYIRDTKDMLTAGVELPSVYGAAVPKQNAADLRTKGLEFSFNWKDQFDLGGRPFGYNIGGSISKYDSEITKYDNQEKTFAKSYYKGQKLGEIWGFRIDGLFDSDAEAQKYASEVDLSMVSQQLANGWKGGDLKYRDLDGDGKISLGANNVNDPGDREIIGNRLPRLSYGFTLGADYYGFDFSMFFQGTGNHHWYPNANSWAFWGPYSQPMLSYLPKDFMNDVWDYDNKDAYFPRARSYVAYNKGGELYYNNDRYLQNLRYLRLKNVTFGYTLPKKIARKIALEHVRVYFSGENLAYWSPLKKHTKYIDPEAAMVARNKAYNRTFYPWQKTLMFGIDVTF